MCTCKDGGYPEGLGFSKTQAAAPSRGAGGLGSDGAINPVSNVGGGEGGAGDQDEDDDETQWKHCEENGVSPRRHRMSTRLMKNPVSSPDTPSRRGERGGGGRGGGGGNEDGKVGTDAEENDPPPRNWRAPPKRTSEAALRRYEVRDRGGSTVVMDGGRDRDGDEEHGTDREEDGPSPMSGRTPTRPIKKIPDTPSRRRDGVSGRGGEITVGDGGRGRARDRLDEESGRDSDEIDTSPTDRGTSSTRQMKKQSSESPPRRRDGVRHRGGGSAIEGRSGTKGRDKDGESWRDSEENDAWARNRETSTRRRTNPRSPETPWRRDETDETAVMGGGEASRRRRPTRSGAAGSGRFPSDSVRARGNLLEDITCGRVAVGPSCWLHLCLLSFPLPSLDASHAWVISRRNSRWWQSYR